MALIIAIALIHMMSAEAGFFLASMHQSSSPVWPASGIGAAAVFLFGWRGALGIFFSAFFVGLCKSIPPLVSFVISAGNTLEAFLFVYLLRRMMSVDTEWKLLFRASAYPVACAIACLLSAAIGTGAMWLGNQIPSSGFFETMSTWWVGNALGILIVGTLLMIEKGQRSFALFTRGRTFESFTVICIGISLLYLLFLQNDQASLLFFFFPLVLWLATRFGALEVRILILAVAAFSVVMTVKMDGPFHHGNFHQNVLSLQIFLAALAITAIALEELKELSNIRISTAALLASWVVSGLILATYEKSENEKTEKRLMNLIADAKKDLTQRMLIYEDTLRAASSYLVASETLKKTEWHEYVQSLRLPERYPGARGLGIVLPVAPSEVDAFVKRIRNDGLPEFTIRDVPGADRSKLVENAEHYVITYLESVQEKPSAIGLDIGGEIGRRRAADQSRDTGEPVMTPPLKLIQDRRTGLAVISPIYKRHHSIDTVAKRRESLRGWVFAPFIADEFFRKTIGELGSQLDFQFRDPGMPEDFGPILQSTDFDENPFGTIRDTIVLGQRPLEILWKRSKHFTTDSGINEALLIIGCSLVAILIAMVISSLQLLGERADEIAKQKTALLREREAILSQT
ncbi:MAG TPA: CHASE domain-containing protein, partial [Bdellovibrionales bacterium]|nr:CHASE domain-containing protein [Bdellovibrionales bacterium]